MKLLRLETCAGQPAVVTGYTDYYGKDPAHLVIGYIGERSCLWDRQGRTEDGNQADDIPICSCPDCHGQGYRVSQGPGYTMQFHDQDCPRCDGLGVVEDWRRFLEEERVVSENDYF